MSKFIYDGPLVRLSGRNPATATTLENINELSNLVLYSALGDAHKLQVSSSSANDDGDPAGTGAQKLKIIGLDANYDILEEEITLDGQTQVETTSSFLRVFMAYVSYAGSVQSNVGDIYVIKTGTGGTVTAGVPGTLTSGWVKILAGFGQGTSGVFTVPRGKMFELRTLIVSARGQPSEVFLCSHNPVADENAFRVGPSFVVDSSIAQLMVPSKRDGTLIFPAKFPEKTDIYLRCLSASANGIVTATAIFEQYRGTW